MRKRILALTLALSLLLTACSGGVSAATMHLRKTEGTVGVSDGDGKDVTPRDDLGLYSGYGVDTSSESYAWIDLDEVKLTKLDQDSEIAITKEGKKLEIEVKSGSLFFNVTEPLADDESMNIRTSTMIIGIRGTCGWVTQDTAALLEGAVEVTAGEQAVTISAGEMAVLTADRTLEVVAFSDQDIPDFVFTEVEDNEELMGAVSGGALTDTGFVSWADAGLTDHVMDWRDEALAEKMVELTGITDREIMLSDVWELDGLFFENAGISDISALGELTNFTWLDLGYNNISDINALSSLTNLHNLTLHTNNISDISALSSLTNLQTLDVGYNNNISDISVLSGLTNLQELSLAVNNITDISPLSGLTNLQFLGLGFNNISDVSALSRLTNLQYLDLSENNISNVSALSGLTNLQQLELWGNHIIDYSPVEFVPDPHR